MATVSSFLSMETSTKASMSKENPMEEANISGQMALSIQEALKAAWEKGREFGLVIQVINTKATLALIEKMAMESLNGLMVICIKDNFVKIWGKEKATCSGVMAVYTKESGKEVSPMVEACLEQEDRSLAMAFLRIIF